MSEVYDYIVIGGGTAGLVVASRLTENPDIRVLVVEAGKDHKDDDLVDTPGLSAMLLGNEKYDWNFTSVPQTGLNNRVASLSRGKGLGGSSAINFMLSIFPSRFSIDSWGKLGNDNWQYDDLKPYYNKFATLHMPPETIRDAVKVQNVATGDDSDSRGPIQLSYAKAISAIDNAWAEAHGNLGMNVGCESDSLGGTGATTRTFYSSSSVDPLTGTRSYAAKGYYGADVRQRANLTVLTDTVATRIELTGSDPDVVATGVELRLGGGEEKTKLFSVRREVILAAGAFQSPQLLEVSGIGGKDLLESHGINVYIDNPNVGENLQDHPQSCVSYELQDGQACVDMFRDPQVVQKAMAEYQETRGGPLTSVSNSVSYLPIVDDQGFVSLEAKKALLDELVPDTGSTPQQRQVKEILSRPNEPAFSLVCFPCQLNIDPYRNDHFGTYVAPMQSRNYMTILHGLAHPFSRGTCHIQSPAVAVAPAIDPKYMTHPADVGLLARGTMFGERLMGTEPFKTKIVKEGGARMPDIVPDSLDKAVEVVRTRTISNMHPCGTCCMMPRDQGGVVDSRLRLYGARNIRVVDASVFPLVPLGNIQPTVYAVAERAADFIKSDQNA